MSVNQELNILTMPLRGRHLIEASAGTGKTYTLATVVVRMLLGHQGFPELNIENILVVTFTNSATEELKDRIRNRIKEVYQVFIGCHTDDALVQEIVDTTPNKDRAICCLDLALRTLDDAAVYTIHGFCHKLLTNLAFEAGQLFEFNYLLEDQELLDVAVKDVWRRLCYPLTANAAKILFSFFKNPDDLYKELQHVLYKDVRFSPSIERDFKVLIDDYLANLTKLHQQFLVQKAATVAVLNEVDLNGITYGKKIDGYPKLHKMLTQLEDILTFNAQNMDLNSVSHLFYSNLKVNRSSVMPAASELPLLVALEELAQNNHLVKIYAAFMQLAKVKIEQELDAIKLAKNTITADDLLLKTNDAIIKNKNSAIFCRKILEQYPVALIDEFQDTDPIQYNIFNNLYKNAREEFGLFMIGDPKQAIYSFRGADIFTYMKAKQDTESGFYLSKNYRSNADMVAATNNLFAFNSKAFVYQDDIAFDSVKARDSATDIKTYNNQQAITYHFINQEERSLNKSSGELVAAMHCANEISRLLNSASKGQSTIDGRPIRHNDIAILVRSKDQADLIQKQLKERFIDSIFLSRESVFNTTEARELRFILQAMADPKEESKLRNALSTSLMGMSLAQIEQFNSNEAVKMQCVLQFHKYQQEWLATNWLSAFMQLMQDYNVTVNMLSGADSHRSLTNLRHLMELVQQESKKLNGIMALLGWYDLQLTNSLLDEERQLRLESEHNLIQIVTIHKSKGLEYNICWLPFVSLDFASTLKPKNFIYHDDVTKEAVWSCLPTDTALVLKDKEDLAENVRLLYVAITRAKYICNINLIYTCKVTKQGIKNTMWRSALSHLLRYTEQTTAEAAINVLSSVIANEEQLKLIDFPLQKNSFKVKVSDKTDAKLHYNVAKNLNYNWRLSSYSGLIKHNSGGSYKSAAVADNKALFNKLDKFAFEKGANAGNCLHYIYENIDFGDAATVKPVVQTSLMRYGIDLCWLEVVIDWVTACLQVELLPDIKLAQVAATNKYVEMEFHLPMRDIQDSLLNKLLHDYGYSVPEINFPMMQGILKGFIDLVFFIDGKYYIADYKSNHLGDSAEDYIKEKLQHAMTKNQYQVQYIIYTVALHRYLSLHVVDYDYNSHFGGCLYLFLRGMEPTENTGVFFDKPSYELINELDAYFAGGAI